MSAVDFDDPEDFFGRYYIYTISIIPPLERTTRNSADRWIPTASIRRLVARLDLCEIASTR